MITITNFSSGEIEISDGNGHVTRLERGLANRLVMGARMQSVVGFLEKLSSLIVDAPLREGVRLAFEGKGSTDRWALKEKIARLMTLAGGYEPRQQTEVIEKVTL